MLPFTLLIGIGTVLAMTIQLYRHGFHGTHDIHVDVGPSASNNILGLIWSDEFDGDSLDLTKWSFVNGNGCDVGLCGWGKISYIREDRKYTLVSSLNTRYSTYSFSNVKLCQVITN
jgi:hypothetical protein